MKPQGSMVSQNLLILRVHRKRRTSGGEASGAPAGAEMARAPRGAAGAARRAGSFTHYSMQLLTDFCDSVTSQTEPPRLCPTSWPEPSHRPW